MNGWPQKQSVPVFTMYAKLLRLAHTDIELSGSIAYMLLKRDYERVRLNACRPCRRGHEPLVARMMATTVHRYTVHGPVNFIIILRRNISANNDE